MSPELNIENGKVALDQENVGGSVKAECEKLKNRGTLRYVHAYF